MNLNYKFSFILGYRHNMQRFENLKRVLNWINGFDGSQIILVEQDTHSKISHLNLKCKHIFVKSKIPFNKSWSYNIGLKYAKSDIVIFSDTDIVMEPNSFISALREISNYDMISPYSRVVDLEPEESKLPLKAIFEIDRPARGETDIQKVPLCGGMCIFRRDAINKIGGWSEDFIGWGGEDDFQTIKVENFLNWKEMEGECYHLYHNKAEINPILYKNNISLLERAKTLSKDDLYRLIVNSSKKIGMLNKYNDF